MIKCETLHQARRAPASIIRRAMIKLPSRLIGIVKRASRGGEKSARKAVGRYAAYEGEGRRYRHHHVGKEILRIAARPFCDSHEMLNLCSIGFVTDDIPEIDTVSVLTSAAAAYCAELLINILYLTKSYPLLLVKSPASYFSMHLRRRHLETLLMACCAPWPAA